MYMILSETKITRAIIEHFSGKFLDHAEEATAMYLQNSLATEPKVLRYTKKMQTSFTK